MSTVNGGAMSSAERFKNIEDTLLRIEGKLDRKVDVAVIQALVHRVEALETGESPLAKSLLRQWDQMQIQLTDVVLHGSTQARQANQRTLELDKAIEDLEKWRLEVEVRADTDATWTVRRRWLLGTLGTFCMVFATVLGPYLGTHIHL